MTKEKIELADEILREWNNFRIKTAGKDWNEMGIEQVPGIMGLQVNLLKILDRFEKASSHD